MMASSAWAGHKIAHLVVHLLENFKLRRLIGPIIRVVALVPVGHHPPALESSLLTSYGLLSKRSRFTAKKKNIAASLN